MYKFNSIYSKLLVNKSSFLQLAFNKFSFKNFYFQESGRHGAGEVKISLEENFYLNHLKILVSNCC